MTRSGSRDEWGFMHDRQQPMRRSQVMNPDMMAKVVWKCLVMQSSCDGIEGMWALLYACIHGAMVLASIRAVGHAIPARFAA
jgi:hypothetical protein